MKYYIDNEKGQRIYIKNGKKIIEKQKKFSLKGKTYSAQAIKVSANDTRVPALIVGATLGAAAGIPVAIIGGLVGGISGTIKFNKERKEANALNRKSGGESEK